MRRSNEHYFTTPLAFASDLTTITITLTIAITSPSPSPVSVGGGHGVRSKEINPNIGLIGTTCRPFGNLARLGHAGMRSPSGSYAPSDCSSC